ncbi:Exosome complex protein [Lachnellula cervina]|uniref:Exosome complex protein n=1 Tax=Lachnellula cervina TaxID=1316786 RepID=A0A7D8UT22_9HELO|nr:Exosome complex protein [Lachnellula cervina]
MDSSKVLSLLDQLDDEVDDLEEALTPLLKAALAETSSKLPLLDKAKLYTLVTYAIESLLFSCMLAYLRLHGIKAREHPVFTELTRVKQYFDKIKMTETPPSTTRTKTVDKAVARRFLEPDLAASKKDALLAAELKAKEKARAHIKFDELNKQIEERQNAKKRKSDGVDGKNEEEGEAAEESSDSDSDSSTESVNQAPVPSKSRSRKKRKVGKGEDSLIAEEGATSAAQLKKKGTKKEKKKSKEKRTKKDKGK